MKYLSLVTKKNIIQKIKDYKRISLVNMCKSLVLRIYQENSGWEKDFISLCIEGSGSTGHVCSKIL